MLFIGFDIFFKYGVFHVLLGSSISLEQVCSLLGWSGTNIPTYTKKSGHWYTHTHIQKKRVLIQHVLKGVFGCSYGFWPLAFVTQCSLVGALQFLGHVLQPFWWPTKHQGTLGQQLTPHHFVARVSTFWARRWTTHSVRCGYLAPRCGELTSYHNSQCFHYMSHMITW